MPVELEAGISNGENIVITAFMKTNTYSKKAFKKSINLERKLML